jgi:adenine-specific DNA-methyltransferase
MSEPITPERLPLVTDDPLRDRLAELRRVLPEAFAEGKLAPDKLAQLLGAGDLALGPERYGLNWAGKSDAIRALQAPSVGTLLPCRDQSVDFDTTGNLIIEGDNLEVLKLLQRSYYGKVKLIYIDPPYNTGNEFIYPDNYSEGLQDYLKFSGQVSAGGVKLTTNTETDGRYHSKWLSMMYPRLFLARNLLREDGVIFISIDDHEVHNLRLVMNEIFGEENFVESFVWKKSYGGGAKEQFAVRQHEYCLLYARSVSELDELWLPPDEEAEKRYYKYRDEHVEKRGPYRLKPLEATKSMDARANLIFPITAPDGSEIWPKRQWWWSRERVERVQKENGLHFVKTDDGWSVSYKQYLIGEDGEKRGAKPFSIIDGIYTQHGTEDLRSLFEDQVIVQFPKPVELLKKLLLVGAADDAIVLDFFAGSGTTAQAVLELNKQDGGDRKFILVQLPEPTERKDFPTIADITRERVRRVIRKLDEADAGKLPLGDRAAPDRGFKAITLASSNFKIWDAATAPTDAAALAEKLRQMVLNLEDGREDEAILYEIILKSGLPLTARVEKLDAAGKTAWRVADGALVVCLDRALIQEALRAIIALKPQRVVCLDLGFAGNDALKTNTVLEMKSHGVEFATA